MNKKQVQSFLSQQDLHPLKRFGQNFLIDTELIQTLVEEVKKLPPPYIEVGPGLGALTQAFSHRKKDILLVEKDKKLAAYWKQEGWQVLCADILKLNEKQLPPKFSLFGNLPYEIFGSLIVKATCWQSRIQSLLFMGQKEPALRVTTSFGQRDYGFLSVISQTFWHIVPVLDVPPQAFYPRPKVSGRVLLFHPKNSLMEGGTSGSTPPIVRVKTKEMSATKQNPLDPKAFLQFLRLCFRFKRKKLVKQLPAPSPQAAVQALKDMGLHSKVRAEELSPSQFVRLYELFSS